MSTCASIIGISKSIIDKEIQMKHIYQEIAKQKLIFVSLANIGVDLRCIFVKQTESDEDFAGIFHEIEARRAKVATMYSA